ncbi:DUF2478 domain-containing protein [Mesorhizobium sp. 8]|uniref:DUF2478 domain-containing protein n=1 Tax=Mesorhizobium sp. 8 TaxID=2584466 RepID=UPI001FEFE2BE|nr:DUF2478 domain-containing protein [Mesorhizobium sp. 8]
MAGRIAFVGGADSETIQRLFAAVAADLKAEGVKVAGALAEAPPLPDSTCSAGLLRTLGIGEAYSIHLDAAPAGTSCHLDARGVELACAAVLGDMRGCDLVVLSKFGKLEAVGEGLFPAFAAAVATGTPTLTTVSARHRQAWLAFAPGADLIDADIAAVKRWWHQVQEEVSSARLPMVKQAFKP